MIRTDPTPDTMQKALSPVLRRPLSAKDLDATGHARGAVLIDLAEQAAVRLAPEPNRVTDIKMLFCDPIGAEELCATPVLRHKSPAATVVEVELTRADGTPMCLVSLTFMAQGPATSPALHHPVEEATPPLRKRRADVLISAATQVIAKKGFASATMRDIAKAAGTHVPTLYEYFPSKEALLEAIYRKEMEASLHGLSRGVDPDAPAVEQLRQLLSNQLQHAADNRQAVALLNREFRHLSQSTRAEMTALYHKLIAPFDDVLKAGIAAGELRPVDSFLMANIFETTADMLVLRPFFFKERAPEDYRHSLHEILISGLRKT